MRLARGFREPVAGGKAEHEIDGRRQRESVADGYEHGLDPLRAFGARPRLFRRRRAAGPTRPSCPAPGRAPRSAATSRHRCSARPSTGQDGTPARTGADARIPVRRKPAHPPTPSARPGRPGPQGTPGMTGDRAHRENGSVGGRWPCPRLPDPGSPARRPRPASPPPSARSRYRYPRRGRAGWRSGLPARPAPATPPGGAAPPRGSGPMCARGSLLDPVRRGPRHGPPPAYAGRAEPRSLRRRKSRLQIRSRPRLPPPVFVENNPIFASNGERNPGRYRIFALGETPGRRRPIAISYGAGS